MAPSQFFLLSRGFWEVERASGEEGEQRVLLEGRGGGGLKVVVIFGREGQGWGGWGHRRHGRGVGKLGALQEACSGNPPRDVNALSKRGPNPNPPKLILLFILSLPSPPPSCLSFISPPLTFSPA